ncbi:MAG: deoxyribonuclease IV [Candidatus Cloacimonetes bacterium]|nr:deoxyribonuclease IV [Candidatus Cloacimonadota bacterium]
MKYIGAHVSASGGVWNAPENAHNIGAKAFALFTKNQRQWKANQLNKEDISLFKEACSRFGYDSRYILPHDSYLINLGHPEKDALQKSRDAFIDEVRRCEQLGLRYLNFHPGSTLKRISNKECLAIVVDSINKTIDNSDYLTLVIETTAGMGSSVGSSFEELSYIIERVEDKSRIGVCIDMCHIFAAGYDIGKKKKYEETMRRFEDVIGLQYLKGAHLNDSKKDFGSGIDRHAPIGKGFIGIEGFRNIMNDERFDEIPLILETPERDNWKKEIILLYDLIEQKEVT